MTTKNQNPEMDKNEKIIKEIEAYQQKIKSLEKELTKAKGEQESKIEELKPKIQIPGENVTDDYFQGDYFNSIQIPENWGIVCINISKTHHVNLVAGPNGQGNVYELKNFGDRVTIPHSDLREIIRHHKSLFEKGFFAILSVDFLKKYDLYVTSQKILNREMIEAVLNVEISVNDIIALFKSAPKDQREMLVQSIVKRLAEDPNSYDSYTVSKLSRELKIDFEKLADEQKQLNLILAGEEE
jgi:hypothetical protein